MLNLFAIARQFFDGHSRPQDLPDCSDDPLSHPALQRMSLEQLADLPFDRGPVFPECRPAYDEERAECSRD